MTAGYIWDEIADMINEHGKDVRESIKRSCQIVYYHLIGLCPWEATRQRLTATLSATASYLLPANLVGIEAVYDATNEIEYFPGTRWGAIIRPTWYYLDPVTDPLALLQSISVASLASVWTSGAWLATYVGEYIRFGKEPGLHNITAE